MSSVLELEPWKYDSKVVPIPWRESEEAIIQQRISSGGLKLGFYENDGIVRITAKPLGWLPWQIIKS
jgi:amidase